MDQLFNGATLGAFRILHQIGEGGMAKVYKAYQPSMERYVALKVLPSHFAEDPQFIERFIREARTIAALEHRNILPVFDFGEQNGITYMAMRYVEGGTLKELLGKGRLILHDTQDLMNQICAALDYAHRRGVIHRDVKPSNVILDGEGAAYLMDFGIAKVVGKSGDLTATGAAIGTPAYMAPEQAMGGDVDGRTDIYALGILLYEMVVGRVPFQADTPIAVLMAHLRDPLPLPRQVDASVSEPIEVVIIKALAKNPEDRYQTANELAEAFRKAIQVTAPKSEASTLVTLIREVQTSRPVSPSLPAAPLTPPGQRAAQSIDPRLRERMEQDYIDGLSAYWIRDWIKARACFQAVLAVDPAYKDSAIRLQEVEKQMRLAELYIQAQEAMSKNDWSGSLEKLHQLVALDKEYQQSEALLKTVVLRIEMGELYAQAEQLHQAGQWQAVVNIFERIKALDPAAPDPKGLLSQAKAALAEQQRLEKVRATYQRGLEALEAGKWKEALKLFEQVKAQQPGYGDVDLLIKRVQAEINRTRVRPGLKTSATTKVSAIKPAAGPAEPPSVTPPVTPISTEPEQAATQIALKPSKRRIGRWILGGLLVLVALAVVLGGAAFAAGRLDKLASALGLLPPTPTTTPRPSPIPAPSTVEFLFDDFQYPSADGMLDLGRWEPGGNCEAFSNYGRLIQDGVVLLLNKSAPEMLRCQLWPLKGQRVPGVEVGALEAGLNFVEQTQKGYTHHALALLTDYQDKQLKVNCGLGTWSNGKFVQAFSVVETKNGKQTELAYQEADAAFNHWYTTRLLLNPATMTFECRLDDHTLGTFKPENGDVLRQASFARFLETERGPQSEARTLFDDVRLIPLPGAELWDQNKPTEVVKPVASALCPEEIKGWRAEFWDNPNLKGEAKVCGDRDQITHFWEKNSPVPGKIPVDNFSARFTRTMAFGGGVYRFRLGSDDGSRLWVDDKLLIDQWHEEQFTIYSADIDLSPGVHTLRVDYFEGGGAAILSLDWVHDPGGIWAAQKTCVQPAESLLAWWAGDGDGSNDRPGPPLELDQGVKFMPGLVDQAFQFEPSLSTGSASIAATGLEKKLKDLQTLTIETWVRLETTKPMENDQSRINNLNRVLGSTERFVTLGGEKAVLRKEPDGKLHFYLRINGELQLLWSPESLPRGEFIHVAGTYDGKWMILYWNGNKVEAKEISGSLSPGPDISLSGPGESLFGLLDEVSVYGTALSRDQIRAIYAAGPYGKCK